MYTRWVRFLLYLIPIKEQEELIQIFTALHNDLKKKPPSLLALITFWTIHLLDLVVLSIVLHVEYFGKLFLTILFWLCLEVLKVATALFLGMLKNSQTNNKLYEVVLMLLLTGIAVVTLLVSVIVAATKSPQVVAR